MIEDKINERYKELCTQLGDLEYSKYLENRRFEERIIQVRDEIGVLNRAMPIVRGMEKQSEALPVVAEEAHSCTHLFRVEEGEQTNCVYCGEIADQAQAAQAG